MTMLVSFFSEIYTRPSLTVRAKKITQSQTLVWR